MENTAYLEYPHTFTSVRDFSLDVSKWILLDS